MNEPQETTLALVQVENLSLMRDPSAVLAEAQKAAQALRDVISKKIKPVIFNNEQYLEFEDWQTVGRFYGVTAKITETNYIEYGIAKGFEAKAVAILIATGQEISSAEAICMNDEQNWRNKPLYQLKSMCQTRACAKSLRNILSWVVVLAGYKPTPAEEMEGVSASVPLSSSAAPQRKSQVVQTESFEEPNETQEKHDLFISEKQQKRLFALLHNSSKSQEDFKSFLANAGIDNTKNIKKSEYEIICNWIERG